MLDTSEVLRLRVRKYPIVLTSYNWYMFEVVRLALTRFQMLTKINRTNICIKNVFFIPLNFTFSNVRSRNVDNFGPEK